MNYKRKTRSTLSAFEADGWHNYGRPME